MLVSTDKAVELLNSSELVALPTETVYGLAAKADSVEAVHKVFQLKNRPLNHPLILHIADTDSIYNYTALVHPILEDLAKQFWPGPLSMIVEQKSTLSELRANKPTVAVRCPNNSEFQYILKKLDTPLVAPSANPFKKTSPTTAIQVQEYFPNLAVIDGGSCPIGIESTTLQIQQINDELRLQILRPGSITQLDIDQVLRKKPYKYFWQTEIADTGNSPGMIQDHYQPDKELILNQFSPFSLSKITDLLGPEANTKFLAIEVSSNADEFASKMYQLLWQNSKNEKFEKLFIDIYDKTEQKKWQPIINRLEKAATYRI